MEEEMKKGRGRPRKYPIDLEPKEKRPRGRPRKEVDEAELNKEKRPRGRPRKEVDEAELNKPKRGRGRPRKDTDLVDEKLIQNANEVAMQSSPRATEIVEGDFVAPISKTSFDDVDELFDDDEDMLVDTNSYDDEVVADDLVENTDAIEPIERRSIRDVNAPKIAAKSTVIPAKHFKEEQLLTYDEKVQQYEDVFEPVMEKQGLNISRPHNPEVPFGEKSSKPIVKTKNTTKQKIVVVTGATSGLGLAMAKNLSKLGQIVFAVGRRPSACRDARNEILAECPDARLYFFVADLSLMGQVRILADEIKQKLFEINRDSIDVIIHNAGVQTNIHKVTYENHELMWATNYLSAFLLTKELQPLLDASRDARVITVTNDAASKTKIDWRNVRALTTKSNDEVYNQTKLADLMFALEYDHKYSDRDDLHAYCVNPGKVATDLRTKNARGLKAFFAKLGKKKGKTIEQGIETTMYLCLAERLPKNVVLYQNKKPTEPSKFAVDPRNRTALWRYTELELQN